MIENEKDCFKFLTKTPTAILLWFCRVGGVTHRVAAIPVFFHFKFAVCCAFLRTTKRMFIRSSGPPVGGVDILIQTGMRLASQSCLCCCFFVEIKKKEAERRRALGSSIEKDDRYSLPFLVPCSTDEIYVRDKKRCTQFRSTTIWIREGGEEHLVLFFFFLFPFSRLRQKKLRQKKDKKTQEGGSGSGIHQGALNKRLRRRRRRMELKNKKK